MPDSSRSLPDPGLLRDKRSSDPSAGGPEYILRLRQNACKLERSDAPVLIRLARPLLLNLLAALRDEQFF